MSDAPMNPDWDGRMRAQSREPKPPRAPEIVTHSKACAVCGGTEFVCADCNGIVTGEAAEEIRREIREGTPDTPQRIATIKRADEVFARSGIGGVRAAPREPSPEWFCDWCHRGTQGAGHAATRIRPDDAGRICDECHHKGREDVLLTALQDIAYQSRYDRTHAMLGGPTDPFEYYERISRTALAAIAGDVWLGVGGERAAGEGEPK